MMHEHDAWREVIEPPAGGLTRLIAAVEPRHNSRHRLHWQPVVATGSAFALLLALGIADYARTAPQRKIRAAIQMALQAPGDNVVRVENGAALELPSSRPDVRIFLIASLPAQPDVDAKR